MRKPNSSQGVTLIELCFSVALVAVLATLAVPGFHAALRGAAVRSAMFELTAGLQQTRTNSIVAARPGVVCLADHTGKCLPGTDSSNGWSAWLDIDGRLQPLAGGILPEGLVLHASRPRLNFWPDARAASTGTLTICDAQGIARPRAVVLSQGGRIRLADGNAADCRT